MHADMTPDDLPTSDEPMIMLRGVARYDGVAFAGWQIQPDRPTVQGAIESALSRIARRPIRILGASRTDAGVHAYGQVFSFRWPAAQSWDRLALSVSQLQRPHLRIERIERAPAGFHATHDALGKRYAYTICMARALDPFLQGRAWSIPWRLDTRAVARLARRLEGTHDFAGFQSAGSPRPTTVRTLYSVRVLGGPACGPLDAQDTWRIEYVGDGFLYRMVRNLTGTLVDIARGYRSAEWLDECLASPGPFKGLCAPAEGLTLVRVYYPGDAFPG